MMNSLFTPFRPIVLLITILLWTGFGFSLFLDGTDRPHFGAALLPLLLAGLLLLYDGRHRLALPRTPVIYLGLIFWIYVLISLSWSSSSFTSAQFFFILSVLPWLFLCGAVARPERETVYALAAGMAAALVLVGLWVLTQFFFLHDTHGPRIHHPFLDPNNMAAAMNMGLMPAAAMFMAAERRKWRYLAGFLVVLFTAGLFATQSRGGFIGMMIAMAFLLPLLAKPFPSRSARIAALVFMMAAAYAVLHLWGLEFHDRGIRNPLGGKALVSLIDRGALWTKTLAMIADRPWTGTGLGTFYFHYSAYRLPVDRSDGYFAHNNILQFAAEMGVMAPCFFYATMAAILVRTVRALNKADDKASCARIAGSFAGMLVLIMHAQITFHLYLPALLLLLSCLLVFWFSSTLDVLPLDNIVLKGKKRRIAAGVLAVCVIFSAYWLTSATAGIYLARSAQEAIARDDFTRGAQLLDRAERLAPSNYFRVPEYRAWMILRELASPAQDRNAHLVQEGLDQINKAIALNPAASYLLSERGKLYYYAASFGLVPNLVPAISDLTETLRRNPLNLDARLGLARLYGESGNSREAQIVLEEGLEWPRPRGVPDVQFLMTLAQVRLARGDRAGHDEVMAEAQKRAKGYGLKLVPK